MIEFMTWNRIPKWILGSLSQQRLEQHSDSFTIYPKQIVASAINQWESRYLVRDCQTLLQNINFIKVVRVEIWLFVSVWVCYCACITAEKVNWCRFSFWSMPEHCSRVWGKHPFMGASYRSRMHLLIISIHKQE